jgi:adenosylcobyric acid synthase
MSGGISLMVQGTGSDVGKSLIVAGLARALTLRGMKVRPFKPQNMSNNAAVTREAGEIGRAQALQARACRLEPSVHMNPLLLKPETDRGAQVVLRGTRVATMDARTFMAERRRFLPDILASFEILRGDADIVLVEGAGSPAEINLRDGDIANMGFAEATATPVLLLGDVHRGGVIASLVGTLEVIGARDAARIHVFAVNNFRGDVSLFDDAVRYLEERMGRPCAGVVPHFAAAAMLPAEDAVALEAERPAPRGRFTIAVPRLSRIANFDDLDPLRLEPDVNVLIVQPGAPIPAYADLVLLPGSKSTIGDLKALRGEGWDVDIAAHVRRGGRVLGVCGGFQMLGRRLHDPHGIEGPPETIAGLGHLDVETTLDQPKSLETVRGTHAASGADMTGYEMHIGRTEGTYLHGMFAADGFRRAYLGGLGARADGDLRFGDAVERTLDGLAAHLEAHLDIDLLLDIAAGGGDAAALLRAPG